MIKIEISNKYELRELQEIAIYITGNWNIKNYYIDTGIKGEFSVYVFELKEHYCISYKDLQTIHEKFKPLEIYVTD